MIGQYRCSFPFYPQRTGNGALPTAASNKILSENSFSKIIGEIPNCDGNAIIGFSKFFKLALMAQCYPGNTLSKITKDGVKEYLITAL